MQSMKNVIQSQTEKVLLDAGFSAKEIAVYIALLQMGKGTVTHIARKASVNRTTSYEILNDLVKKGVVRISGKEPKQEYVAEPPETIEKYIDREIAQREDSKKRIRDIIPELQSVHDVSERPRVKFYEGLEGLQQVFDDTLTAKSPIVAFATYDTAHTTLPKYFEGYYKKRAKAGITARGIVPSTPMALERQSSNKEELRDLALVPGDKYMFSPDIEIYDNKVMIASWREKLGIIIESHEIADALKKIFELAWIGAKEEGK